MGMVVTHRSSTGAALAVALAGAMILAGPASAHALPQSSDPSPGANLATAPTAVTITFGERPDPKLSTIKVLDTAGHPVTTGPATAAPGDPKKLSVPLKPLGSGVYTVAWRTVSAVDGHLATGSFAFGVGAAPPTPEGSGTVAPPSGSSGGPSPASIAGRWLLFLGLIGMVGAGFFGLAVARAAPSVTGRLLPLALLSAAMGTVVVMAVQVSDAGVAVSDLLGTSLGMALVERVVPILVAATGVVLAARGVLGRPSLAIIVVGAAAALFVEVLLSHAAAGLNATLSVAIQALHVMAVGLWLGGLAGLLVTVRGAPDDRSARTARRFSWVATVGIATVAITGLLRAIAEVGTIDRLLTTDFGRLVIAKTALLGGLAGLGAINHFRNVPAAGRSLRGLRRVGSLELLLGGTILLLSASLVNLAPPSQVAAAGAGASSGPGPAQLVAEGSDFGTSVRVRLQVSPGSAGFNRFEATVRDYDTGAPVAADGVTLRFSIPARPDIGGSRLDLPPTGGGVFATTGGNLSLDGTWQVTAVVVRGAASVEVPLQLTTLAAAPAPSPTIDVNPVAGLPTIYTVHLSVGRTVQVYVDPGHPGKNAVHATFFDQAGVELPVRSVMMVIGPTGGPLVPLKPRLLEPGHFVADTVLVAGTYHLSISGPAPNGDLLTTQLDVPVTK